jgi:hypothetical protein
MGKMIFGKEYQMNEYKQLVGNDGTTLQVLVGTAGETQIQLTDVYGNLVDGVTIDDDNNIYIHGVIINMTDITEHPANLTGYQIINNAGQLQIEIAGTAYNVNSWGQLVDSNGNSINSSDKDKESSHKDDDQEASKSFNIEDYKIEDDKKSRISKMSGDDKELNKIVNLDKNNDQEPFEILPVEGDDKELRTSEIEENHKLNHSGIMRDLKNFKNKVKTHLTKVSASKKDVSLYEEKKEDKELFKSSYKLKTLNPQEGGGFNEKINDENNFDTKSLQNFALQSEIVVNILNFNNEEQVKEFFKTIEDNIDHADLVDSKLGELITEDLNEDLNDFKVKEPVISKVTEPVVLKDVISGHNVNNSLKTSKQIIAGNKAKKLEAIKKFKHLESVKLIEAKKTITEELEFKKSKVKAMKSKHKQIIDKNERVKFAEIKEVRASKAERVEALKQSKQTLNKELYERISRFEDKELQRKELQRKELIKVKKTN